MRLLQPPAAVTARNGALAVSVRGVAKRFGSAVALADCSLEIAAGSFVALLGPSGSGKTTLLNIVAGFLAPDAGEILFDGRPVSGLAAHRRNLGMVFQSYALFPHRTVFQNVEFPLRMRTALPARARADRVAEALRMVRMEGLARRRPSELSGGQRQRVAMARALVSDPPLILLDEPLAALDKALREELVVELKALHRSQGATFVCVTHDQGEAMAMADTVAVMRAGRIVQSGPPAALWDAPATAFVASFLGGANLIPVTRDTTSGTETVLRLADGSRLTLPMAAMSGAGRAAVLMIRPDAVALGPRPGHVRLPARFRESVFQGERSRALFDVAGADVAAWLAPAAAAALRPGEPTELSFPPERARVLPPEAEERR